MRHWHDPEKGDLCSLFEILNGKFFFNTEEKGEEVGKEGHSSDMIRIRAKQDCPAV